MTVYQTTLTQKGQITIPKTIREALHLVSKQKVRLYLATNGKVATIEPAEDFLTLAAQVQVTKKIDPLQARQQLEQRYERT